MHDLRTTQNEAEIRASGLGVKEAESLIQDWRGHAGRLTGCGCSGPAAVYLDDALTEREVGFCQRHAELVLMEGDRYGRE